MSIENEIKSQKEKIDFQSKIEELLLVSEQHQNKNIKKSIQLAEKAKRLSEEHFYTKGLAQSLILLGKNYQNISNYGEAMKSSLQAMELCKGLDDKKGESACLDILGGVYNFLGDYNKRLDCNLKCLALRKQIKDSEAELSTTNNIGDTYMVMGDLTNALKYFKSCLNFPNLTDNIQAIVYYNIGEVYFDLKDYKLAKANINKGLDFGVRSNYWQIIIAAYQIKARMLINENNNKEALQLLKKAQKIALENESKEDEYTLYRYYSNAYWNLNQHKKAYYYLNKYNELKEEFLNDNNVQKLRKIEFEFQFKSIKTEAKATKEKNKLLTRAFKQIEVQRNEIELKNSSITDSIRYAKRIQNALLPTSEKIKNYLANSFVFYRPKDIVSGDFYWIDKIGEEVVFSVIDCTGHGVPGAFVSLIAHNALNKVILEKQITEPAQILTEIDKIMINSLSNTKAAVRDGMDMGICSWNLRTKILQFSGAYHSIFIHDGESLIETKGNRESIGYSFYENKSDFINHVIELKPNSTVYLSSDGFPDQFGGEKGKKLKWRGFKNLLNKIGGETIDIQHDKLQSFLATWKGDIEQVDDVCVIGVKL